MVAEQYQHLLDLLGDETLRSIAVWKLEGYTVKEIAQRLDRSERMVAYKLELIRLRWEEGNEPGLFGTCSRSPRPIAWTDPQGLRGI